MMKRDRLIESHCNNESSGCRAALVEYANGMVNGMQMRHIRAALAYRFGLAEFSSLENPDPFVSFIQSVDAHLHFRGKLVDV